MWWHSSPGSHHWESQAPRVLRTVFFLQYKYHLSEECMIVNTKDKCLLIYLQLTLKDSPQAYFHCNWFVALGSTTVSYSAGIYLHPLISTVTALLFLVHLSCPAVEICLQPLTSTVTALLVCLDQLSCSAIGICLHPLTSAVTVLLVCLDQLSCSAAGICLHPFTSSATSLLCLVQLSCSARIGPHLFACFTLIGSNHFSQRTCCAGIGPHPFLPFVAVPQPGYDITCTSTLQIRQKFT
jgi:hypothetical protein